MNRISLNGKYNLYFYDANVYRADRPEQLKGEPVKKIEATVPGNVEFALSEHGFLPKDLFYSQNILKTYPFESYDFWYEREFTLTAEQLAKPCYLQFNGADTIAEYFLNGTKIGESKNMLIAHRFSINGAAKTGKNRLFVKLASDILYAAEKEFPPYILALPSNQESVWLRKPPHAFGWDIMPRALSRGLWRDVELLIEEDYEIESVYFATTHVNRSPDSALVWFNYSVKMPTAQFGKIYLQVDGACEDSVFSYRTKLRFNNGTARIGVDKNLKLWNPAGYGKPYLYDVSVKIADGEGNVLAEKKLRFGIRLATIEYSETGGSDSYFKVEINRVPVLVKGTNWVPADAFHSRDRERVPRILREIRDLGCNAVRCWGGNVYEDDEFFEFCDENGIMVWQDFAMACSQYPHQQEFLDMIAEETKAVAVKLRNHCSLITYCGDNECDVMTFYNALDPNTNAITRKVIPETLQIWDPFRKYIPSSPYISPKSYAKDDIDHLPELHLWGPRDNFKSMFYRQDSCNFIGEIGYHGCTSVSSIRKFIPEDKLWPPYGNEDWIVHCTDPEGKDGIYAYRVQLMANQIRELFGEVPDTIEDFVLASQISQAEAKKFFIEYARQKKWERSGIIWWNAMDGWPQFSDAVIDYYFNKKLACYYIKRSQRPVTILMKEPDNWTCELVIANDSDADARGTYEVIDADTDEIVAAGEFYSPANKNVTAERIPVSNGVHKLFLLKLHTGEVTAVNHYLHGHSPFDFRKYKEQLKKIAALDGSFDAGAIGK